MVTKPRLYYGLDGKPIDPRAYALSVKHDRLIAERKVWFGTVKIMTEWTGLDQSYQPGQKPMIFQTLLDIHGKRSVVQQYGTIDAALIGHKYWTEFYRSPSAIIKSII